MTKFTDEDLTVYYNEKPVTMINPHLLNKQNRTMSDLIKIKELHVSRLDIEDQLQTCRLEERKPLLDAWTANQMSLQRAWGFPEDAKFHRFWEMEGCACAKLDNSDAYPTGYYTINQSCPIHGKF